jgi:quinol monooxygenase YgiN
MTFDKCAVYELRRYTLHPGTRDEFVRLFEAELLDTQDTAGMQVLGQFHDADRPDTFVWIRGFTDMERRREALTAFYYGPVWAAHSTAANAMMIDSDDVLLLEPAGVEQLAERVGPRPPLGAAAAGTAEIEVAVHPLRPADTDIFLDRAATVQQRSGGEPLPALQTLHTPNTFPQLPVHEDRHVAVTLTRHADPAAADRLRAEPAYQAALAELDRLATGPVHRLRLTPTPRSALR